MLHWCASRIYEWTCLQSILNITVQTEDKKGRDKVQQCLVCYINTKTYQRWGFDIKVWTFIFSSNKQSITAKLTKMKFRKNILSVNWFSVSLLCSFRELLLLVPSYRDIGRCTFKIGSTSEIVRHRGVVCSASSLLLHLKKRLQLWLCQYIYHRAHHRCKANVPSVFHPCIVGKLVVRQHWFFIFMCFRGHTVHQFFDGGAWSVSALWPCCINCEVLDLHTWDTQQNYTQWSLLGRLQGI